MAAQKQLAGRRGAIVALDPKNGDVLAFVSNPSYDPNPFVSGISSKEYGMLRDDIDQPLYNRALQGLYPPASTIKPFESMGFLHYGIMGWNDTIFDPGYFSLPGDSHRFRDWKKGGHGTVNMSKSIIMSVDTYYYKNAHRMGIDKLHDWMSSFGFGKKQALTYPTKKGASCHRLNGKWTPTAKNGYQARPSLSLSDKEHFWQAPASRQRHRHDRHQGQTPHTPPAQTLRRAGSRDHH
ncbi:penicillin-binding transpeptidase domain-containing protein [Moraxella bovis]|uniref:penicillin-binding transpeptidase domain-containing protein n=1 Tax=Moraxella bovis TaxID=476 RepID=UPI0022265EFE|nr:penicillin-binding transpeptidase domain-containing protein [Moraxella bovis]